MKNGKKWKENGKVRYECKSTYKMYKRFARTNTRSNVPGPRVHGSIYTLFLFTERIQMKINIYKRQANTLDKVTEEEAWTKSFKNQNYYYYHSFSLNDFSVYCFYEKRKKYLLYVLRFLVEWFINIHVLEYIDRSSIKITKIKRGKKAQDKDVSDNIRKKTFSSLSKAKSCCWKSDDLDWRFRFHAHSPNAYTYLTRNLTSNCFEIPK